MTPTPALLSPIEHFAELSARLANPFADRRTVLFEKGLDGPDRQHLAAHWAARPSAVGATLAPRFAETHEAAVRALRGATLPLPPKPGAELCDVEIFAPHAGRSRAPKIEGSGISVRGDNVTSTVGGDAQVARC